MKNKNTILIIVLVAVFGFFVLRLFTANNGATPAEETNPNSVTKTEEAPQSTSLSQDNSYTMEEVENHDTEDDCWMVINSKVYDVTGYVPQHPGSDILKGCGKEATALFEEIEKHQGKAQGMLGNYEIGIIAQN